jgi:hypothetical protein
LPKQHLKKGVRQDKQSVDHPKLAQEGNAINVSDRLNLDQPSSF